MEDNQIQELWNQYKELLLSTNRPNIENLVNWLENDTDFKVAPASTQYHCSFRGGLLQHSLNVYYATKDFQHWIDMFEIKEDTLIITALLHDICKANCYNVSMRNTKNESGQWVQVPFYTYDEQLPWGHGDKSVILILQHGVYLDNVEISMIRNHMGFSSSDDERRVSKLFRLCPQSVLLHCADLEATMMMESFDGPQRFIDKMLGKNIVESLEILNNDKLKTINILGTEYSIAPQNAIVDDKTVIEIPYNGSKIKVYSPFNDGLPF